MIQIDPELLNPIAFWNGNKTYGFGDYRHEDMWMNIDECLQQAMEFDYDS